VSRGRLIAAALLAGALLTAPARAGLLDGAWPAAESISGVASQTVQFPSRSPFVPEDIGGDDEGTTQALATLYLPEAKVRTGPLPAVVMLHGASGVIDLREGVYGRQLAAMGVAALVVDSFGARREFGTDFADRILNITETMLLADAYAALEYLVGRGDIDPARVVLVGFSYGGMASIYGAYAQAAELLAPTGSRFAAHVAFYAPCIARFEEVRTTGAPVLMLYGGRDDIVEEARCAEIVEDLRRGGSAVETVVYPEAVHQWDGRFEGPRPIGRNLASCRFEVESDGTVRDRNTLIPMVDSFTRKIILGLCIEDEPYLIGRDDAVRARSNRDFGRFLARIFGG
jgi:dienelactone hydrolase